jgi:hypothetical protein
MALEDRLQSRDPQQIVDSLAHVQEPELTACILDPHERGRKLAEARAVDVVAAGKIDDDFALAGVDEKPDVLAKHRCPVAKDEVAVDVDDDRVADVPRRQVQAHRSCLVRGLSGALFRLAGAVMTVGATIRGFGVKAVFVIA